MKSKIITVILGSLLIVSIIGNIVLFNNNKSLHNSAIQFNTKIEELETAVKTKETELKDSENKISELEKQITDLQSELDTLNEKLIAFNETNLQIDASGVDGTTEEDEYDETRDNLNTQTTEEKSTEKITLEPDENGEITVTQEEADAIAEQLLEEIMKGAENTTPQYDYSNLPEGCTPYDPSKDGNYHFGESGSEGIEGVTLE